MGDTKVITDIECTNFQGYEDLSISLHPGLNVIIGDTNSGKSSVVRLLTWIFENRPRGDAFRNHGMGKKDNVTGSVAFDDDTWVTREKGGGINQYEIPTSKEPLKALRTDVPVEVREVTKMHKVNIQSQHPDDQYFMLTESPGQVAKRFNKVANLVIMDDALTMINGMVREVKQVYEFTKTEIEKKDTDIKALEWSENAKKRLDLLAAENAAVELTVERADFLYDSIEKYQAIEKELEEYSGVPGALKEFLGFQDDYKNLQEKKRISASLKNSTETLKNIGLSLKSTELLEKAKNDFNALNNEDNAAVEKRKRQSLLRQQIKSSNNIKKEISTVDYEIESLQKRLSKFTGTACPTCGGVIK